MDSNQLLKRTKKFALNIIKFFQTLPKTEEAKILGRQFLKCGTSTAADYRAACRARSKQEFYAKICIVVEECDESQFWLELFQESGIRDDESTKLLMKEAEELLSIFYSTKKSTAQNLYH